MKKNLIFCALIITGMQFAAAQEADTHQQEAQQEIHQEYVQQPQSIELTNLSPDGEEMYQKALQTLKTAVTPEDYANVLAFAKKILIFDPNRADVHYKIGEIALFIEEITGNLNYRNEAVRYFEKAVQIDEAYGDMVDEQYQFMSFEEEPVAANISAPVSATSASATKVSSTTSNQPYRNDLIMLIDGRISQEGLNTIQKNQPFLYNKYFMERDKHKRLRNAGWITFGTGLGVTMLAGMLSEVVYYDGGLVALGVMGTMAGLYAGIPMVVVGAVRMKRNDRRIVDEYNMMMLSGYRAETTFSLGTTSNGIGFLVKF